MKTEKSRRLFLSQIGLATLASTVSSNFLFSCGSQNTQENSSNQVDSSAISNSETPIKNSKISWGCSIITWGNDTLKGIQEIASLGYKGIQLRANLVKEYEGKIAELKALLEQNNLEMPVFSSGGVSIEKAKEKETIDSHVNNAKFISQLGGKYLQLTTEGRPKDRKPTDEELKRLSMLMNEIGKRTNEFGIMPIYHNHMDQLGETPEEVDIIVENCNPQYVNFLLDIAHYYQGGGDPAKAIIYHKEKLKVLHIKDLADLQGDEKRTYQFVEFGQGKLNLMEVFNALEEIKFEGWCIDELDGIPKGSNRSALECHQISKKYIEEVLKFKM
jgi:inosose dehydratase